MVRSGFSVCDGVRGDGNSTDATPVCCEAEELTHMVKSLVICEEIEQISKCLKDKGNQVINF